MCHFNISEENEALMCMYEHCQLSYYLKANFTTKKLTDDLYKKLEESMSLHDKLLSTISKSCGVTNMQKHAARNKTGLNIIDRTPADLHDCSKVNKFLKTSQNV